MREYINWIIDVSKTNYVNSRFKELNTNTAWNELPILVKLFYLDEYIDNYPIDEQYEIERLIRESQSDVDFNEPSKVVARIVQIIDYIIEKFPYHEFEARSVLVLKFKEIVLKDSFIGKNPSVTKPIDEYLTKKLEIIKTQKENYIFDEREDEQADIDYFNKLKTLHDELFPKFQSLVSSNEYGYNEEIIKIYIHLFIETPNLEKSDSEHYVPNTLPYLKTQLKQITLNKRPNIFAIREIIFALEQKLIELKERLDDSKRILSDLNPKRYYAVKSNIMHIYFKEKSIINLEALIKYVNKNYYENRSKLVFPDKFEDTITDLKTFKKIIEELKIRTILDKDENGNYKWNLKANELGSFLLSLEKNSLLKEDIRNNHIKYSYLICAYFNVSFTPRALQNSKKSKKFEFISNLK